MKEKRTLQELEVELKATRVRLEEAEETLRAIRNNEVDALIVDGPQGQQVFTLQGADLPYRTLMETMSEGALTTTTDGTILYCNSHFSELIGMPLNKIIGVSIHDFIISSNGKSFKLMLKECGKQGCRGEFFLRTGNGGEVPVSLSARSLMMDDVEAFCIVAADLTDQKRAQEALETAATDLKYAYGKLLVETEDRQRAEEQLIRVHKLEALGTLANGIAHDFNNILAGILGFTEMVYEDLTPDSPEHKRLGLVLKGAQRGRDLVKQILAFSRQNQPDKKPVSVNAIVEEGIKLLRPLLPSTIEIVTKSLTTDDRIFADHVQIHQILMNLCTNAAHAMREKGGVLELRISKVNFGEKDPMPFSDMVPGQYVILGVQDTGIGMTPEILDRIFDPFFTTKKQGEGTGLGLSVLHGIVQSHGGHVSVESEPGKGTTFYVYLPKIDGHAFTEDGKALAATKGSERILFVDDEDMLVTLNEQRLTRLGYDVVATKSSMDALDIFRKDPDAFDLVITDYTMPNMTGVDLARELLKVKPATLIILCTGDSEPVMQEHMQGSGIKACLMKPLAKSELAQAVRRVLDDKRDPR